MKTIDKIITKVDCRFGAPMGRENVDERPAKNGIVSDDWLYDPKNKLYDCAVPLIDGYDRGGAYWGTPSNLRVKYTKDLSYIEFYRSK